MALWPFRRGSNRKHSWAGPVSAPLPPRDSPPSRSPPDDDATRAMYNKKQRNEPAKLRRRQRTYSFSPGRNDAIRVDRSRSVGECRTDQPARDLTPTLHLTNTNYLSRRKSSKRRRDDHEREAEIKALIGLMPPRPSAVLSKQGSKRAKMTAASGQWPKPDSDLSLPLPGSIHSNRSADSSFASFKVSVLDSLAPRPTLRYTSATRTISGRASVPIQSGPPKKTSGDRDPPSDDTVDSRRRIDDLADGFGASDIRELMERDNRRRERKKQHDQEKIERKLTSRAEKHLSDQEEARKLGTPSPKNLERGVPGRELIGLGIGSASANAPLSKPVSPPASDAGADGELSQPRGLKEPHSRPGLAPKSELTSQARGQPSPTSDPASAGPSKPPTPPHGPAFDDTLALSKKSQLKSLAFSPLEKEKMTLEDDSPRKDSEASNRTSRLSITSLLRWGGKNRRNSGPVSFSNTSREEMQAAATAQAQSVESRALAQTPQSPKTQDPVRPETDIQTGPETVVAGVRMQPETQTPAQAAAAAPVRVQANDGVAIAAPSAHHLPSKPPGVGMPRRMRSRFREDLPDFPLSPPDSRVQSPEADPPLPKNADAKGRLNLDSQPTPAPHQEDWPLANRESPDAMLQTPRTGKSYGAQSPEPHPSMSLASIDSEGSWLSGRTGSRLTTSNREETLRHHKREQTVMNVTAHDNSPEDLAIADDEYLSRLARDRVSGTMTVDSFPDEGRPSSDEDEVVKKDQVKWGAVGAKPQLVRYHDHDMGSTRSREGLLNYGRR